VYRKWLKVRDNAYGQTEMSGRNTKMLYSCGVFRIDHICTDYQNSVLDYVAVLVLVFFFCSTTKHGSFSYVILCVMVPGFFA
jgi:uncharacterized membrane protein